MSERVVGETPCVGHREDGTKCPVQDVTVERTSGGSLTAKCHKCKCSWYGTKGTPNYYGMAKAIGLDVGQKAAPVADPQPAPPEPAKKPARSVFDLASLS